ncbi:MAG TPA: hypothetical protein VIY53_12460 [Acidobacteriaceae bacterium]
MTLSNLKSFFPVAACLATGFAPLPLRAQAVTIPDGVPLRVQIDHRYRVHAGKRIEGHLIAPIDHVDHVVLPVNTRVTGTILGMERTREPSRARALLDGQFAPPAVPAVRFDSMRLPDGANVPIETAVTQRDATVVTMSSGKKPGLRAEARAMIEARKREAMETIHHPNLGDRLVKWVYAQLPWSPPTIWAGTEYDAELTTPVTLPGAQPAPLPQAALHGTPTGDVEARLLTPLSSATGRHGAPVTAVLTAPLLTPDGKQVVFPEGAEMTGMVTLVRPARWFARNGQLRFAFRSISRGDAPPSQIHGQLAGAETSAGAHVQLGEEGTARSSSGPGKYLAPMALGVMAASAYDSDATSHAVHSGVDSNGFGFAARILVMASANPTLLHSFAVFAVSKSIYYRWIARGHQVEFPKDTRILIQLNAR